MEPFHASLPPDLSRLRALRHALKAWLELVAVSDDQRNAIVLAVHEAAANAIEHAGARVTVRGARDEDKLLLVVSNSGRWRELRSNDAGRGRGLSLMRALMTDIEVQARPERTIVRMRIDLPVSVTGADSAPSTRGTAFHERGR